MKKLLPMFLVLYICSTGICMAADVKAVENPMVISIDNIDQIWMEKSKDLVKFKSQLNFAGSTFEDLADKTDEMSDAPLGSINMSAYNSLWNSRDQAELSYKISQVQYKQNIQNAKIRAKQALLTCWQDELNVKLTQSTLSSKQTQLQSCEILLRQGYFSQYQYDNIKTNVNSLKDNLDSLKLQQETDQILLKSKLGLKMDDAITLAYPQLNKTIFETLFMKINYAADLATYQKNNINLSILQITFDINKKQSTSYAQIQRAEADLMVAKATLPDTFKVTYNNLISQYIDLINSYSKLEDEYNTFNKTKAQYLLGVRTLTDYSNAGLSYSSAEVQVKTKEISLYSSYLAYLNMVAGN